MLFYRLHIHLVSPPKRRDKAINPGDYSCCKLFTLYIVQLENLESQIANAILHYAAGSGSFHILVVATESSATTNSLLFPDHPTYRHPLHYVWY